ncbi:MAG: nucleoside triphosphate pyrophosphohydrolase [Nitrospirae bacterium]|nr:nucleoside triphosphate pyrophosphohydrolase [Nitrospirota bacterium]
MSKNFDRLVEIMERLRGEQGCPWDRKQTRDSLKPYLIEEAYEVLEALEEKDPVKLPVKLKGELGDLLYQILFHAQISKEAGEFDIEDILTAGSEKMVRRHPHVFGDKKAEDADEVLRQWEAIKKIEKGEERKSILEGVPPHLPALLRAHQLQARAARVGFDWEHADQVFSKVIEEMKEFEEAFRAKDRRGMEDELGDLLFALVNIGRFIEVNPEDALRKSISRFISRFRHIEEEIAREGKEWADVSLEEMEMLWQEAKEIERSEKQEARSEE